MRPDRLKPSNPAILKNRYRSILRRAIMITCLSATGDYASAQIPTGGDVIAGHAAIFQAGNAIHVNAATTRTIVNWDSFNVGVGNAANFNLPDASSAILNRVTTPNVPSTIAGSINSNGNVLLINPSGILVNSSGRVNTNGFTASAFDIANAQFMAGGALTFVDNGSIAAVVNQGTIATGNGGTHLIANQIANQGVIASNGGNITLSGGGSVTLENGVTYVQPSLDTLNRGISPTAGRIQNSGTIRAIGAATVGGEVYLVNPNGRILHDGSIVAQNVAANGTSTGGHVQLEAADILLTGRSTVDATGSHGGGTVLVGGDWQGSGSMTQAQTVTMAVGALIDASAMQSGNGGKIVLWSDVFDLDSVTNAFGTLFARGGELLGNGGLIETSGHTINTDGIVVNAGATHGMGGLWLIDPADSVITQNVADSYAATLNTGTSVLNDVLGTITWNNGVTLTKRAGGDATLTLRTGGGGDGRDILLNGATIGSNSNALNLVFWTRFNSLANSGKVTIIDSTINTNGGHLWIGGGTEATWNGLAVGNQRTATWVGNEQGILMRNSSISTGAGNIAFNGHSYATDGSSGVRNFGILLDSGSSLTTTSGTINIDGLLQGQYANGAGVYIGTPTSDPVAGDVSIVSGSGSIQITGRGEDEAGSASGWRHGTVFVGYAANDDIVVRSTSGDISVNGIAAFGSGGDFTSDTSGVQFQVSNSSASTQIVSSTGNLSLSSQNTQEATVYENALRFTTVDAANRIRIGYDGSNAYSGNILLEGNSILQLNQNAGQGSISVQTTGNLTIAPLGSSFTALRAGPAGTLSFDDDWNFGTSLGGFTFGKSTNTSAISLSNALQAAGPISVYGGSVVIGATLDTSSGASIADVLLHGSNNVAVNAAINSGGGIDIHSGTVAVNSTLDYRGNLSIIADNSDLNLNHALTKSGAAATTTLFKSNRHILLGSGASINTTGGSQDVHLWADSDNSGDGINTFSAPNLNTNGGSLTIGNGNTTMIGGSTVLVGGDIYINGTVAQLLQTGGGNITINGETIVANLNGVTFASDGGNIFFNGVINSGNQYNYVDGPDGLANSWDWSREDAKNGTPGGANVGDSYLVTISSRLENAIAGIAADYRGAWIGAYRPDPAGSYNWQWADGPEAGQVFFVQSGSGGTQQPGWYANFGPGEPNGSLNASGESRGQFFGNQGLWNDLGAATPFSGTQSSPYSVLGYVRETNLSPTSVTIDAGATGNLTMGGVGGGKSLASLNVTAAGVAVNGDSLITTGLQNFNSTLTVISTSTLDVRSSGLTTAGDSHFEGTTLGIQGNITAINNSDVRLRANAISLPQSIAINTSGRLTIEPLGNSFSTALTYPLLNLSTPTMLGGLTIGKATNTADITLGSAYTVDGDINLFGGNIAINNALTATGLNTIRINASGNVTDGPSGYISTDRLLVEAAGTTNLDSSSNAIGTFAFDGADLTLVESDGLTIGTVVGKNGVNATGTVNLSTITGNLTVGQDIVTTDTSAAAITLNAGRATAAGTSTGGNIIISGSPVITTGSGGRATLMTGSIVGSTGLSELIGLGSGRFRYNSDESNSNFSLALANGLYGIYRELPTVNLTVDNKSMVYADALPTLTTSISGNVNGDTIDQIFANAGVTVVGTTSTSGHYTAGSHALNSTGTSTSQLGYSVAVTCGSLSVNARTITPTLLAANKVYDGTTTATISGAPHNFISGDLVSVAGTAEFADKNAGLGKSVSATGLSLNGADAANYTLQVTTGTATADITPKAVTISGLVANNRVYDGTTSATVDHSGVVFDGLISGDELTASGTTGTFDNKHVGVAKTVTLSGTTYGGTDVGNYSFTDQSFSTADVTAKSLVISGIAANNKTYDGNAVATVDTSTMLLDGLLSGDNVTLDIVANFADKNVGSGKTVSLNNTFGGVDRNNYSITDQLTALANILRLDTVTWIGGATGNWSDPNNWAGGAIPDLANVANVIIPAGGTPIFDHNVTGPVNVDSILGGNLQHDSGTLNVAGDVTLDHYIQSDGWLNILGNFDYGTATMVDGLLSVVGSATGTTFVQNGGTTEIGGNLDVADFEQNGGSLDIAGGLDVTNSFTQTVSGTIDVVGDVDITHTTGDLTVANLTSDNVALNSVNGGLTFGSVKALKNLIGISTGGPIKQFSDGSIYVGNEATFNATRNGKLDEIDLSNTTNRFIGKVNVTGSPISIQDASGNIKFGVFKFGNLDIRYSDNISRSVRDTNSRYAPESNGVEGSVSPNSLVYQLRRWYRELSDMVRLVAISSNIQTNLSAETVDGAETGNVEVFLRTRKELSGRDSE